MKTVSIQIPMETLAQAARECEETKMPRGYRNALAWAVRRAGKWRGSLVGNPDPAPLAAFDAMIKRANIALKMIRK